MRHLVRSTPQQTGLRLPALSMMIFILAACGPLSVQEIVQVTPLPPAGATTPGPIADEEIEPRDKSAEAGSDPTATPTPLNIQMPAGSAAAIAMATDVAMRPAIDTPLTFDENPVYITFDEFYSGNSIRGGVTMSEKLLSLDGKEVVMEGYMAPPLKPELDWFVLTAIRLEFCPFCSSDADWPADIAVIYLAEGAVIATQAPVRVHGRMEIGSSVDPETGMVSLVRIYADEIQVIRL